MFCSHCGKEIDNGAYICVHCGYLVKENQPVEEKNGIAVAGFVCSFFSPLLGWIFGGVGLSRAGKRNGKGKGFADAAIVISTIMFVLRLAYM